MPEVSVYEVINELKREKIRIEREREEGTNDTLKSVAEKYGYSFSGTLTKRVADVPDLDTVLFRRNSTYSSSELISVFSQFLQEGYEIVNFPHESNLNLVAKRYEGGGGTAVLEPYQRRGDKTEYYKYLLIIGKDGEQAVIGFFPDTDPEHAHVLDSIAECTHMKPRIKDDKQDEFLKRLLGGIDLDI